MTLPRCFSCLTNLLLKPKLHIRGIKHIVILKQDQLIQNLTEYAAQRNCSVVVRHSYWFALIFWNRNPWDIMIVNKTVMWSRSLRVPLIMWSDKIDDLISSMINDTEQRPTTLPMSSFVSSNSAAICWGSHDTQLYNDLYLSWKISAKLELPSMPYSVFSRVIWWLRIGLI